MASATMTAVPTEQGGRQAQLDEVLRNAQQAQPGVFDLVQAYGDSEEALKAFGQYLAATRWQPVPTTSNQSQPTPGA